MRLTLSRLSSARRASASALNSVPQPIRACFSALGIYLPTGAAEAMLTGVADASYETNHE